jgi:hypothetical protein
VERPVTWGFELGRGAFSCSPSSTQARSDSGRVGGVNVERPQAISSVGGSGDRPVRPPTSGYCRPRSSASLAAARSCRDLSLAVATLEGAGEREGVDAPETWAG